MKKKKQNKKITKKGFWTLKRRVLAFILMAVVIGACVFATTPQGKTTIKQAQQLWAQVQQKSHLELKQVPIQGHNRTQLEDINRVLNLAQGMPILDIDLNEKRDALLTLPWIRSVVIERMLPDTMIIQIQEKTPIAIWQHNKKYWPIDEFGETISDNKTVISNVLLVVGEDAPKHTPHLIEVLAQYPMIQKHVRSAVRVGKRRWDLYMDDAEHGLVVQLPETDIGEAINRLREFNETGHILDRDINVIDLKLPDRLIIRSSATITPPESLGKKKNTKKK